MFGKFWKIGKFENVITHITKVKFEEKNSSLAFTLGINYWEITLSAQEQKKITNLLHSVIERVNR